MNDYHFDAVIFDLDGVITDTASVHSAAWKKMFDIFLQRYSKEHDLAFREFSHENDYLPYVDGKPRYQGVTSFLTSRGIDLPFGDRSDPPEKWSICGLGNQKNEVFNKIVRTGNIKVYQSTVDFIHHLRAAGIRVGVASSSKNAKLVLTAVGLLDLFETRVDGVISEELGLNGKPNPDIFSTACDNLDIYYDRAVIIEDAISGVRAGQNGGFGLVLGVARENNSLDLKINGADIVVEDMSEINLQIIDDWFTKGLDEECWSISYFDYHLDLEGTRETLLSIGNGYFGTRGTQEETSAGQYNYPGTYIAGLYNRLESEIAGQIVSNEDFVNCPNWLPITFKIAEGDWFDPNQAEIKEITRRLDFRTGTLHRNMVVVDSEGRQTRLESQRLASMDNPHLAALRYQITPLNYEETIIVRSSLDGDIINAGVLRYRELSAKHLEPVREKCQENLSALLVKSNQSNVLIAEAALLFVSVNGQEAKLDFESLSSPSKVTTTFRIAAHQGTTVTVDKLLAIYTSHQEQVADPFGAARDALTDQNSFDHIQRTSADAWEQIWKKIDIQIEGDRITQKLIRLHLYHTILTCSPHNRNLDAGFPARGLHGEAYRGHIFWDEVFVLPFLNMHFPETVRSGLMYRYNRLGEARKYAQKFGYQGAMFPWHSGSSGAEETQTLHLNPLTGRWGPDYTHLQRHVGLAIAYNLWQYLWITEDREFLENFGAELFIEICRFWASATSLNKESGYYEIGKVMGPDEFHEKYPGAVEGGLKNNSYTNILAAWAFRQAETLLKKMRTEAMDSLIKKTGLSDHELLHWRKIAQKLKVPISKEGILEQFEGYFKLGELDWAHYQQEYDNTDRMDRILKAEGKSPDDYKVAKQADTLMIFYLLNEELVKEVLSDLGYHTPDDFLRNNFSYYFKRTSHGSTLSRLVHAYLAHRLSDYNLSWDLFSESLISDFMDTQGGTTKEGVHLGVMTGTAFFILRAFAGINIDGSILEINPNFPSGWRKIQFNIGYKRCRYNFEITPETIQVHIDGNIERNLRVYGKEIILHPEKSHIERKPN
jgi:HAD superfamily hydrolase (TIGR01509 family)